MGTRQEREFRVIILGEAGVGKSSLIRQYAQGYFSPRTTTTIGVDRIPVEINVDEDTFQFQVLDAAGCFGFRTLIKSYLSNVDAVIFVYDLTNKESFACLPLWNTILKTAGKRDITKILVGNKLDIENQRQVQFKNAKNYAEFEGMVNMEVSVKKAENVDLVFQCVAREMKLKRQIQEEKLETQNFELRKISSHSVDFIDEELDAGPKQFVRKLSLMMMGRKNKANFRRDSHLTPLSKAGSTPLLTRRYEQPKIQSIKMDHFRWT